MQFLYIILLRSRPYDPKKRELSCYSSIVSDELLTYVANKDVFLFYNDVLLTYVANKDDVDIFLVYCDVLLTYEVPSIKNANPSIKYE